MLDQTARDKLIHEHLSYVRGLAHQLRAELSPRLDVEELVATGNRGLVEAAQRFDPTRGVAFTTFAYYRVRGAMLDGLRKSGWLRRSEWARFTAASNAYLENLAEREPAAGGGSPGPENAVAELADALTDVTTIFLTSMSSATGEEPPDVDQPPALEALEADEVRRRVRQALTKLPDKERRLMELYYFESQTLEEAGQALGLSKSWSSRLHARAVRLLAVELADVSP